MHYRKGTEEVNQENSCPLTQGLFYPAEKVLGPGFLVPAGECFLCGFDIFEAYRGGRAPVDAGTFIEVAANQGSTGGAQPHRLIAPDLHGVATTRASLFGSLEEVGPSATRAAQRRACGGAFIFHWLSPTRG